MVSTPPHRQAHLTGAFWAQRPRAPCGDPAADEVYCAVGRALSEWETVETAVATLFAVVVGGHLAAKRAYGAIASSVGRLQALKAAGDVFLEDKDQGDRDRLSLFLRLLESASGRRNEIAHAVVVKYAAQDAPGGGFYLAPPGYMTRKTRHWIDINTTSPDPFNFTTHNYAYTAAQINEYAAGFSSFARELQWFARRLQS